jgi:hypothetical protein
MKSILKSSALLVKKEKNSLRGELKTSGKFCEDFLKSLITTHTPNHLRVTSGYILDPVKKNIDDNYRSFLILHRKNCCNYLKNTPKVVRKKYE